jgi:20S proteasome alpha/beta subunit
MTLLIGVHCKDGIAIGCDQKILRGGETEYVNKIFEFNLGGKVLFAAEGLTGIRDDFFLLLDSEIARRRGVDTLYQVKLIVEDIIADLTSRYAERVKEESPVGVLMGGLEKITEGPAELYYIHGVGYGEKVGFRCTGHGGTYAYSLAKFLFGSNIAPPRSTQDVARLIAFVISWVAEDVDSTVGGSPQVVMLKDEDKETTHLDAKSVEIMSEYAKKVKSEFVNYLRLEELLSAALTRSDAEHS